MSSPAFVKSEELVAVGASVAASVATSVPVVATDKVPSAAFVCSSVLVAVGASVVSTVSLTEDVNTTATPTAGFHTKGTLGDSVGTSEEATTSTCPVPIDGRHS